MKITQRYIADILAIVDKEYSLYATNTTIRAILSAHEALDLEFSQMTMISHIKD